MAGGASVVVRFLANTTDLAKGAKDVEAHGSRMGSAFKSMGKAAALGAGAAGIGAVVATLKVGIDEYQEASQVAAQTNAVIKSTGQVAGVSADHVGDLAESLMRKSGIDDEAIASGENLLLQFTKIRNEAGAGNDVFDRTTKAMTDMAARMGTDPAAAAKVLGKALNDPAKGLTKLAKLGVTFTDAQQKQVKAMTEAGDVAGAQKIILGEVEKRYGGAAEAAGKTLPGMINIAKQSFNNLAGELVAKMIPALLAVVSFIREHWPEISLVIAKVTATVKPLLVALAQLFLEIVHVIVSAWPSIRPVILAILPALQAAVAVITNVVKLVTALLRGDWAGAWTAAKAIVLNIVKLITALLRFEVTIWKTVLSAAWTAIKAATSAAWNAIKAAVASAVSAIGGALGQIPAKISSLVHSVATQAGKLGSAIKDGIVDGAKDALRAVGDAIGAIPGKISSLVHAVGREAGKVASAIKDPINAVIRAWNGIVFHVPKFTVGGGSHLGVDIPKFTFGGQSINFPDLPTLARGGVLTRPTLFVGGEAGREIVAPESLLRELLREEHGATYQLILQPRTADAQDVAYAFRRLELLRTGR